MKHLAVALLATFVLAVPGKAHAQEATAFVQQSADDVLRIVNAAAEGDIDARRAELRQAIRGFLSFETLAERTLGDHWETLEAAQQEEFVGLLRDLIETSYSRSIGEDTVDPVQYAIEYTGERSRRSATTVEANVSVDGEQHFLEVKMRALDDGSWIVYDLVTDDVSLEESYAESFASIIAEDGWDGLLSRMRERLEELRAEM